MDIATKQTILTKMTRNTFLRALLCPVMVLRRNYLLTKFAKSEDSAYIRSLHNKYEGKRCFVIGNGPSLTPEDLNRIKDEYTFACNRIYHIFSMTQWRPTWYLCLDNNVIYSEIDTIKKCGDFPKFLNYKAQKYGRREEENIHYIVLKGKYYINVMKSHFAEGLSEDASAFLGQLGSVTINAIEIAIYLGFKEIYLLGLDNNFARKVDKNGKVYTDPTVKETYFKGMKVAGGKADNGTSMQFVDSLNNDYNLAKEFAAAHGVKIFNATRGGKLETFERVDFDELMK